MKNRIEALRAERIAIDDEVNKYLRQYCEADIKDYIEFESIYRWVRFDIKGIGSGYIHTYNTITDVIIEKSCPITEMTTVEDFLAAKALHDNKAKIVPRLFLAYQYIMNK